MEHLLLHLGENIRCQFQLWPSTAVFKSLHNLWAPLATMTHRSSEEVIFKMSEPPDSYSEGYSDVVHELLLYMYLSVETLHC